MKSDNNRLKERFAKWRLITIEELGKIINLILGISTATLGFQINLLTSSKNLNLYTFNFKISGFFIFVSIVLGLITSFNRLVDFRLTAKLLKKRIDKDDKIEIYQLKEKLSMIGERTWKLFAAQTATFLVGLTILFVYFFFNYVFC